MMATFAALSLAAVSAQAAQTHYNATPHSTCHDGLHDITGIGSGETGLDGGGG